MLIMTIRIVTDAGKGVSDASSAVGPEASPKRLAMIA